MIFLIYLYFPVLINAVRLPAIAQCNIRPNPALIGKPEYQPVFGNIKLEQKNPSKPVCFKIMLQGLKLGNHGFHIHTSGNIAKDCGDAGPHFNPFNKTHGGPKSLNSHLGDLGNIYVVNNRKFFGDIISKKLSLQKGVNNIVGRAIVVHELPDDLGTGVGSKREESLKTGNAGKRLACCVITCSQGFCI